MTKFHLLRIGLPLVMAAVTIGLCFATPVTSEISKPGIELRLPVFVGDYMGIDQEISEGERTLLPSDTGIVRRLYRTLDGKELVASIVLAGEDARSIHRPEICLPAQGWNMQSKRTMSFAVGADGDEMTLMCLTLSRPIQLADGRELKQQALYAYAFIGEDKYTPHNWERIFLTSYDRLFNRQNHRWAYIAFLVPMAVNYNTGAADVEGAFRILREYLENTGNLFVVGTKA